ncbi:MULTISPECIES: M4 family metallopeptidase [unclassified Shewanella]|uniref:M4 family metallopeptidase n=1 Tax=unclassified Shewanella TaxID=196818 RepID=UPI001BB8159C|nr:MULTISPECIES: M4 family metallopeptidase [unclassified Shewanella]GIU08200.1 hemagglutinin [Shewanella sp. MBTL60-112-B1]GIU35077.1 hemagglutinin [Shewanella sp. MBTL60-112-B2]
MRKPFKMFLFTFISVFSIENVNSAAWETIDEQAGPLSFSEKLITNSEFTESLEQYLSTYLFNNSDSKLVENKRLKLSNGTTKIRFHQEYMGIPIIGSSVILDYTPSDTISPKAKYNLNNGKYLNNLSIDSTTTNKIISQKEAVNILNNTFNIESEGDFSEAKLYIKLDIDHEQPKLVYLTSSLLLKDKPTRPFALIDAISGDILKKWDGINNIVYKYGPGIHKYGTGPGGNVKTKKYTFGIDYEKLLVTSAANNLCTLKNDYVYTVNLNNAVKGDTPFSYICPNNTVKDINGAFSPLNDAHFYATKTFEMFDRWYKTRPIPTPYKLPVKVHYGVDFNNASWTGKEVVFGDGNYNHYPTTVLDVIAHEIAHAFTSNNSRLFSKGEAGAIGEAFSDMAGETAEYFVKGKNDWMVGYEYTKGYKPLRYFEDRGQNNLTIKHYKHYKPGMQIHKAAGIFNHAFYLLANKPGWDIRKAFGVMLHANELYWQMNTNFEDAVCGIATAASGQGLSPIDVAVAFSKVGVECKKGIAIEPGMPIPKMSGSKKSKYIFYLNVPNGASNLKFQTSKGKGDVDIFISQTPSFSHQECGSYKIGNEETCVITTPRRSRYYFTMYGVSDYSGVTMNITYDKNGGVYRNQKSYLIPDYNPKGIEIPMWVSSTQRFKKASVFVDIEHNDTSELVIDLIDPYGKSYRLHNKMFYVPSKIKRSYQVNINNIKIQGVWALRVVDQRIFNQGKINPWSISFK